ncbi:polymer-forming cytoskeletal protein [Aggregatibacter sp.]
MKEQQKKYELTGEFIEHWSGKKLYRIKALVTFGAVVAGQLGGFVESEKNLDQSLSGDAWVYGNAQVYGNAEVYGNAQVYGNAEVYGDAWVYGNARVYGDAWVYGNAQVCGNARVYGNAQVYGNAEVYGDAQVCGNARVRSHAVISDRKMIFWASNVGSENGTLTVFNGKDGLIVTRGCFTGTVDEFLSKSAEVHDDKTKNEYKLLIEVAKSRISGVKDERN